MFSPRPSCSISKDLTPLVFRVCLCLCVSVCLCLCVCVSASLSSPLSHLFLTPFSPLSHPLSFVTPTQQKKSILNASQEEMKLRGSIPLKTVRSCERCDGSVWGRPSLIQVVHDEAILYIAASDSAQVADWYVRLPCTGEKPMHAHGINFVLL